MESFDELLYEEINREAFLNVVFNEDGDIIDTVSNSSILEEVLFDDIIQDGFDKNFTEEDEIFDEECFISRKENV